MVMTEENRATLSTINFIRTGLGWNAVLRVERLATNRLSHGTACKTEFNLNYV